MADKVFNARFQLKEKTTAEWNTATQMGFIPLFGEMCVYSDVNKFKIGDGTNTLDALSFYGEDKTDKVASAVNGNFAGLNASGNLTDSGYDATDFITTQDSTPGTPVSINADTLENHAANYFATATALAEKLDKSQGVSHAGEYLVVGADGNITTASIPVYDGSVT